MNEGDQWLYREGRIYEAGVVCSEDQERKESRSLLRRWVARRYEVHKMLPSAEKALQDILAILDEESSRGANIGAGNSVLHPRIINLEIDRGEHIHIVSKGGDLPFKDSSLDVCVSQEVLEHVYDPFSLIDEIWRVLKPGGRFYCQVPFVIGYHPGPTDFWRFSREAFRFLFKPERWTVRELDVSLGHGSGLYRILVEFFAVNASLISPRLYMPCKGASAVLFSWLPWLDRWSHRSEQKDRIPGGYYIVVEKL